MLCRLKPVYDKDRYSDPIAQEIDEHLQNLIYQPLLELMEEETGLDAAWNTKKGLIAALHSGKIQYQDGYFGGEFSASISKTLRELGATFDKNRKAFKLDLAKMPTEIKAAVSASKAKADRIVEKLMAEIKRIEEANENLETYQLPFGKDVDGIIQDLDKQFEKTAPKDMGLAITPNVSAGVAERLKDQYSRNLNYYIKGWRADAIYRLREQVEENAFRGFRSTRMIETIQAERGVSKSKARFLARQETSLLVSHYRQDRCEAIGVKKYIWVTSHDVRVRHKHKELDGRVFSFDNPPIVDTATGRRANPGEDFNCRCVAQPVFED